MEFCAREDIAAPIGEVFAVLSDHALIERAAIRRGVEPVRLDDREDTGVGMAWAAHLEFHGAARDLKVEIVEYVPPERMRLRIESGGLTGIAVIDLEAMAPDATRLSVAIAMRAQSIKARVTLQAVRLARGRIDDGLAEWLDRFGRALEAGRFRDA